MNLSYAPPVKIVKVKKTHTCVIITLIFEKENIFFCEFNMNLSGSLFAGVTNPLALKKRYRDLLKIFHPDNLCGDTNMVTIINKQYEKLKNEIDYPFRSAK